MDLAAEYRVGDDGDLRLAVNPAYGVISDNSSNSNNVYEVIGEEGGLSRFAIRYICTHHYFSHEKATRDFGYVPQVKLDEAIERTLAHLRS